MTTESQKAFEEWFKGWEPPCCGCKPDAEEAWQASRQHIIAKLQSEEMVEKVARAIWKEMREQSKSPSSGFDCARLAKAAIAAMGDGSSSESSSGKAWQVAGENPVHPSANIDTNSPVSIHPDEDANKHDEVSVVDEDALKASYDVLADVVAYGQHRASIRAYEDARKPVSVCLHEWEGNKPLQDARVRNCKLCGETKFVGN